MKVKTTLQNALFKSAFALAVFCFAFFPLTDSDIWWHLASARYFWENGLPLNDPFCWTPSRSPWINVHLYFQLLVYFVQTIAGEFGLLVFKSFLWGIVAFLWVLPVKRKIRFLEFSIAVFFAFLFRYAFECRPILLTLFFLGIFWNLLPQLLRPISAKWILCALTLLYSEWLWVRFQGLYPLGFGLSACFLGWGMNKMPLRTRAFSIAFFALLLAVPLFHAQGILLWLYPYGLLDRLMGGSAASQIFAMQIAENRAPSTLLALGENTAAMSGLLAAVAVTALLILKRKRIATSARVAWLVIVSFLAVFAERNLTLFFFPFVSIVLFESRFTVLLRRVFLRYLGTKRSQFASVISVGGVLLFAFTLGFFARSVPAYMSESKWNAVSLERVPAQALTYMQTNPMPNGNLFNDDRSGGYLEWKMPQVKTFADGRFILKDSTFMANYLSFAENPQTFFDSADSLKISRVLLPVKYILLWRKLDSALANNNAWTNVYCDEFYTIWDKR